MIIEVITKSHSRHATLITEVTSNSHSRHASSSVHSCLATKSAAIMAMAHSITQSLYTLPKSISTGAAAISCDAKCRRVVKMVQERYPSSELLAAGWSLGGNILVRYVGEEGDQCPISAAASLCNPLDLVSCFCIACDCVTGALRLVSIHDRCHE